MEEGDEEDEEKKEEVCGRRANSTLAEKEIRQAKFLG